MRQQPFTIIIYKVVSLLLTLHSITYTDAFGFGFSPTKLTALPSRTPEISASTITRSTLTTIEQVIEDEEKDHKDVHKIQSSRWLITTGAFIAAMSLSSHVALAMNTIDTIPTTATTATPTSATTTILLSGSDSADIFALPSYSDAKKNKSIEVDVESINRATIEKSRMARFNTDIDVESKNRSNQVRKEEMDEEDRMERMMKLADEERKEKLMREKEESKTNRWNTF